jgi:hypothetical protein
MNERFYVNQKAVMKTDTTNKKYSFQNINNVSYESILNNKISLKSNINNVTYTNILPNLYSGNRDDLIKYASGVNIIIDVSFTDLDINKVNPILSKIEILKLKILNVKEILNIIETIDFNLQKNRKVFIFCNNGFHNTSFMLACYFIRYAQLNKMNVINCLQSINPLFFSKPVSSTMDLILNTLSANYQK